MQIRTDANYRNRLRLVASPSVTEVAAEWSDDDVLHCSTPSGAVAIPGDSAGDVVETLVRRLEVLGYAVECCATCRYCWYAGLGADSGSGLASCMSGKIERVFSGDDCVHLTGLCDVFSRGSDSDRKAVMASLAPRKKKPNQTLQPTPATGRG